MKQIIATLKSVSPYSQSRYHNTEKHEKESPEDYELRTWKYRLHTTEDGTIFIPPTAFKNCLSDCAKYISMKVPGTSSAKFTKHFEAGVLVADPLMLDLNVRDIKGEWLHVSSTGTRGGSKRVMKCFPLIPSWEGDVSFYILDDTITADVFRYHLEQSGKFIGIGRFRPRNNGYYGRFNVVDMIVEEKG